MQTTRRAWLSQCVGIAALAEVAAAQEHAHEAARAANPPGFQVLDAGMAAELDALTSLIIPSDDGPGAREAGVVYFIDRALATFDSHLRGAYRQGLREVGQKRVEMFPGSERVAALSHDQKMQLMSAIEGTQFFALLRTHTMYGLLGNPSYGGNRDQVGWKLIGFEDKMHYQPPFGYYDAPENQG